MYTVYDFINNDIERKRMKFGWRVEIVSNHFAFMSTEIVLRYDILNFDWNSTDYLNDELWNMFLSSNSFKRMQSAMENAMHKYKRLYFGAYSIAELKNIVELENLKINIDKLIDKCIKRKSEKLKEKISNTNKEQIA